MTDRRSQNQLNLRHNHAFASVNVRSVSHYGGMYSFYAVRKTFFSSEPWRTILWPLFSGLKNVTLCYTQEHITKHPGYWHGWQCIPIHLRNNATHTAQFSDKQRTARQRSYRFKVRPAVPYSYTLHIPFHSCTWRVPFQEPSLSCLLYCTNPSPTPDVDTREFLIDCNTVLCGIMPAGTPEIRVVVWRCLLLVGSSAAAQCTQGYLNYLFRWQIDHVGYTHGCSKLWIPLVLFCN
jgi:hypothetical protein